MFCSKCGNQMPEGSKFCDKCGAQTVAPATAPIVTSEPATVQTPRPYAEPQRKSGLGKLIIAGVGVIAIIAVLVAVFSSNGSDHIETVRTLRYLESEGIDFTVGEVVDKLITSPRWSYRSESRDLVFVDLQGRVMDVGNRSHALTITFRVTPIEGSDDWYWIDPILLTINDRLFTEDAAVQFLDDLFDAVHEGFSSLLDFFIAYDYTEGIFEYFFRNH